MLLIRFPDIAVIIPTCNCADNLQRCLSRIRSQKYEGRIDIIVVDNGSTDETLSIASKFTPHVYTLDRKSHPNPNGLNGSFEFGRKRCNAGIVWHLDSDNFLVEDTVARDLAYPFVIDNTICISIPELSIDKEFPYSFNTWLVSLDNQFIQNEEKRGIRESDFIIVNDLDYGLPNGCMIKNDLLSEVGGYDMDLLVLKRLRAINMAKSAVVPSAHINHNSVSGPSEYFCKIIGRLEFHSQLNPCDRRSYFFDSLAAKKEFSIENQVRKLHNNTSTSLRSFILTRKYFWLWGLAYPFLMLLALSLNILKVSRLLRSNSSTTNS